MVKLYLIAPQKEGLLEGNPYSLLNLGNWVSKNSDSQIEIVRDIDQIKEKDTYVGISVTTPTYQTGLELARRIKQKSPNFKTIFGGYHTKGQSRFIAQHPEIDFVVEGEGEKGLVKILQGETDKIVFGEPLTSEELDSVRVEDLLKSNPEYFETMRQFGIMNYISTRGCPYSCSFCASSGKLSTKSNEKVADDLEALAKEGFNQISIQDNYFGYNPQRIREICNEILGRRIEIDWDCQTRVESMQDESLLRLMADAGSSASYLGTENFHPDVLNRMNKTRKPEDYLRMTGNAIQNMLVAGIKPYVNLQVGLSYETEEIRQTNLEALKELGRTAKEHKTEIEIYPHLNVVYPGTPDFYSIVQRGVPENIFETFTKWEEENGREIKGLLRENHFVHGAGGIPLGILNFGRLREGKFEIDEARVREVVEYMNKIRGVDGVRIYQ
jgi:anaerobic magnesium-protoporphyrin IX monomethyl ester cyclase